MSEKKLREKSFGQFTLFLSFPEFELQKHDFWRKWLRQACQKRFLRVQRSFLKETILNMLIVSEFERKHLAGWMVKTALTCPVERCEEKFISWKKPNFVIASTLYAKFLLGLLQTKLAGFSN